MNIIKNTIQYDYLIKLLILGKESIGKTKFLKRIELFDDYKSFKEICRNYLTTIGIDFRVFAIKYNNKIFKFQLWDTAGQERFSINYKIYYKSAYSFLIFYNALDKESFHKAIALYKKAIKINDKAIYFLVRSKYDLSCNSEKNEIVSDEEALKFADENNLYFAHISSFEKNENGIKDILEIILKEYNLRGK